MTAFSYPSLEMDDGFFQSALAGSVTATIRIGERPAIIAPGALVFVSPTARFLPMIVNVDLVIRTTWLGINDYDAQLAGYIDGDNARSDMAIRYPEASPDTPFTVIRFSRPA